MLSTHDLTQRSTFPVPVDRFIEVLSTHDLTQRSTFPVGNGYYGNRLSTHDLTQRSTSIFHIFYAKFRSYFLYFSQKPL